MAFLVASISDSTFTGYTAKGRRLAPARRLSGVDVQFEIEVPEAEANAMVDTVKAMEPEALVTEIVAQVATLDLADALEAAAPGTDLSAVTADISEPVVEESDGDDLNSGTGPRVAWPLLLGVLVLQ